MAVNRGTSKIPTTVTREKEPQGDEVRVKDCNLAKHKSKPFH
jgi:hypothetical protein